MFDSRLRYNYYTSIISIYQVCCLYSFLFFSFFFLLHSEEIFHTMYNFFWITLEKNCTFFAIKIRKKRFFGYSSYFDDLRQFGKNIFMLFRIWWQKYVFQSTVIVPLPLTMHNKGFFEKLIKRNKKKSSEKRKWDKF